MSARLLDVNPDTVGDELRDDALQLVQRIGNDPLQSTVDLEQAVIDRELIGGAIRRVEQFFGPLKKMAYDLHRAICDRENAIAKPLRALDKQRAGAISAYKALRDRERDEREQALSEQRRREAEAHAAAEAAQLEARGQPELAAAVVAEAIAAPAPAVSLPDETKSVEGLKFRRRWLWRYVGGPADVSATPAPIVARTLAIIPREFLTLDEVKLNGYARAMKSAGKIPGIEIYSVDDPVR